MSVSSNGGHDRVTNRDLYESQAEQDEAVQKKLDRLDDAMNVKLERVEEKIDARPTSKQVLAIVTVSVAANQAIARADVSPDAVRSALAFLGL